MSWEPRRRALEVIVLCPTCFKGTSCNTGAGDVFRARSLRVPQLWSVPRSSVCQRGSRSQLYRLGAFRRFLCATKRGPCCNEYRAIAIGADALDENRMIGPITDRDPCFVRMLLISGGEFAPPARAW